jgi:hypothetical protein
LEIRTKTKGGVEMKVIETHAISEEFDEYCGKGSISLEVQDDNGRLIGGLDIMAGEPEDAVFFRDLNGAYKIEKLMRLAYQAGKNGEEYNYEFINEGDEEEN